MRLKLTLIIFLLIVVNAVCSITYIDSLLNSVESETDIYTKASIYSIIFKEYETKSDYLNANKYSRIAYDNFVKCDSLVDAEFHLRSSLNTSTWIIGKDDVETIAYFAKSDSLVYECIDFYEKYPFDLTEKEKISLAKVLYDYLGNKRRFNQFKEIKEKLPLIYKLLDIVKYPEYKIFIENYEVYVTRYYAGSEAFLKEANEYLERLNSKTYGKNDLAAYVIACAIYNSMQIVYFNHGNLEAANQAIYNAIAISYIAEKNDNIKYKMHITSNLGVFKVVLADNTPCVKDSINVIEERYLDANRYYVTNNKQIYYNNLLKIVNAYDIVYDGNHPKINYYLAEINQNLDVFQTDRYVANYYLTLARHMMSLKKYKESNEYFEKFKPYFNQLGQAWLDFNYVMERSRYLIDTGEAFKARQMLIDWHHSNDKEFAKEIADKTAQLNAELKNNVLETKNNVLEVELAEKEATSNKLNLVILIISIILALSTIVLINRLLASLKLKKELQEKSSKLEREKATSEKHLKQLIISEKLSSAGEMASSIAHEIKNPISNAITALKLISKAETKEDVERYINICDRNSWLAIDKINALLDYTKNKDLELKPLYVNEIVKNARDLSRGVIEKNNVSINLIFKTQNDTILADKKELSGVIVNLILNSVQAFDENSHSKEIELSTEDTSNNHILIKVTDNGPGIPANIKEKVLKPFFTTKETGTGLGLNYASKVVNYHKGSINIESEVGKGTTIELSFPKIK